jgi:predicted nucleic acid-binding protein
MVVSNTSPLNYLILIKQIDLLPQLYSRVLIPGSVLQELNAPGTPDLVRTWTASLPDWLEVSPDIAGPDPDLSHLHAGERDAISLALRVKANAVIIDERRGRDEAEKRGLRVIGTLGVLATANERGLVDLIAAIVFYGKLPSMSLQNYSPQFCRSIKANSGQRARAHWLICSRRPPANKLT